MLGLRAWGGRGGWGGVQGGWGSRCSEVGLLQDEHFALVKGQRNVFAWVWLHSNAVELVSGYWKLPVEEGCSRVALVDQVGGVASNRVQGVGDVGLDGKACYRLAVEVGAAGALLGSQVKGAQRGILR